MAHSFELIQNKICSNKNNTDLMRKIFGRYSDIITIWEDIGFDQNIINNRIELLQKAILSTLDEINEGEVDLYNRIKESIDRYKQQVDNLKRRLNVDLNPVIARLVSQANETQPDLKDTHISMLGLEADQSLAKYSNQTKLLEENHFYKSLAVELERIRDERKLRYLEMKKREESLAEQLDETFCSIANKSVLEESDLKKVEDHVNSLSLEKEKRLQLIQKFHENILRISKENQIELDIMSSLYQFKYLENDEISDIDIHKESINLYRKSMDKLISKRDELIESIETIRNDIIYMWNKFDIRNDDLASYIDSSVQIEYTHSVLQLLLDEYSRCAELKKLKLKDVVVDLRQQIKAIWRRLVMSSDEILKFEPILNEIHINEELLDKHESYLNELKVYSLKYHDMFKLIQEWAKKWDEHVKFEKEYTDPARFAKRNYSSLFEERERKRIDNELSKLEKLLEIEAQRYMDKENKHFKYAGTTVLEFIKAQKNKFDLDRENVRKQRQTTKKSIDKRKDSNAQFKLSTPNNLIRNKNVDTKNTTPGIKSLSKTPITRRTEVQNFKTPRSLTSNRIKPINAKVAQTAKFSNESNKSKKRISFTELHKKKRESLGSPLGSSNRRRSKSYDNKQKESLDVICKENFNFDTILGGHFKIKPKNVNVSSGIESIVSWSDLENPACNSSFNF